MMYFRGYDGLRGLGDDATDSGSDFVCPSGTHSFTFPSGVTTCVADDPAAANAGQAQPSAGSGNSGGSGSSWAAALAAVAGATPAILKAVGVGPSTVPSCPPGLQPTLQPNGQYLCTPAKPWYQTPLGIGALVVAGLIGYKVIAS